MVNEIFPSEGNRESFAGWMVAGGGICRPGNQPNPYNNLNNKDFIPWHEPCK
jgi:hypothetical protein